jgi:hypothetical protein
VNNYRFIAWIDGLWPTTPDNILSKLWSMYQASNCAHSDDEIEHARFLLGATKGEEEPREAILWSLR